MDEKYVDMISEDYVSFETAKLLKEKGFDGECMSMYLTPKPHSGMGNPNEAKIAPHGRDSHYYDGYLYQCEAPTLQMARKWLRREHGLFIRITEDMTGTVYEWSVYQKNYGCRASTYVEDSYELACEAGIKYCLENLI